MEIKYTIEEDAGGVLEYSKYTIEDSEQTLNEWYKLHSDFRDEFQKFSTEDYGLTDWHDGINCLSVYIYNERFYDKDFIPKIIRILRKNSNSFAQFECYDDNSKLLGWFQIYMDKVRFDEMLEKYGIIERLCSIRDKSKLTF